MLQIVSSQIGLFNFWVKSWLTMAHDSGEHAKTCGSCSAPGAPFSVLWFVKTEFISFIGRANSELILIIYGKKWETLESNLITCRLAARFCETEQISQSVVNTETGHLANWGWQCTQSMADSNQSNTFLIGFRNAKIAFYFLVPLWMVGYSKHCQCLKLAMFPMCWTKINVVSLLKGVQDEI